jgi:hypothetical protein
VDISVVNPNSLESFHALDERHTEIMRTYPEPPRIDAPEHTPPPIAKAFRQGFGSLNRQEYEPCVMLMRKVLDLTIKEKNPESNGVLAKRLAQSFEKGLITSDMAEWAKVIKGFGNGAAHDADDIPEDVAREMTYFTEMLLMYLYTLPGMLDARRKASAS